MHHGRRLLVAALALSALGVSGSASADPGTVYKDTTGFGVVVTPRIIGGTSSIQICGDAQLFGSGPVATTVAVATEGAEHYATTGYTPLVGQGRQERLFAASASACTPVFTLHDGQNSTYALEFQIVATGTVLFGAASQTQCTGTVVRGFDGPVVKINPCDVV